LLSLSNEVFDQSMICPENRYTLFRIMLKNLYGVETEPAQSARVPAAALRFGKHYISAI